jgi:hypothetical protein
MQMGLKGVLTKKKDVAFIAWTIIMQECGLSILLPTNSEGCKANINKAYTISRWNTKEQLVFLVQM